ncbi:hypothetical protein QAD02_008297 [Eretmocerus hayati]|uniref:Uncharacterized protein n=1 Tax=Eretmocerus hayati TaxID=131215 RepID=A0ACC2N623_9HYME|nr:hypothetical protein QAD02_008297 [Eretmocerus hayati]
MLEELKKNGPTAKLWVQYFHMVTLMKNFIAAERSGNWLLHLLTIYETLPYFHASGHIHYAKYAHIYLQEMIHLRDAMKNIGAEAEYLKFVEQSFFTIRRSDKFWCGVWSDMTIEQVLMRYLWNLGGIITRGMKESAVAKWTSTQVATSVVIAEFEKFAGVSHATSEQQKDAGDARRKRDAQDLNKLIAHFESREPFKRRDDLVSINSNVVGDSWINCHLAWEIGMDLLKKT